MDKICVIGAGSWGTSIAKLLAEKGYKITLWARRKELAESINESRENKNYLPGIKLPETLTATSSPDCVKDNSIILFAVPSMYLRDILKQLPIPKEAIVAHLCKGLEENSGKFMSQVIQEELPNKFAVISGPNHAEEVAKQLPTATVVASDSEEVRNLLSKTFTTPYFKAYPHDDVMGVELCAVVKNVIALAIGICEGLQLGDNAKGSLLTLGLSEMGRIGKEFGAKRATCYGLAGVGDLIATCFSEHSRNRFVGEMLAKGKSMDQITKEMHGMVAEGVKNTRILHEMCVSRNVEVPLLSQVYHLLYTKKNLRETIEELLAQV